MLRDVGLVFRSILKSVLLGGEGWACPAKLESVLRHGVSGWGGLISQDQINFLGILYSRGMFLRFSSRYTDLALVKDCQLDWPQVLRVLKGCHSSGFLDSMAKLKWDSAVCKLSAIWLLPGDTYTTFSRFISERRTNVRRFDGLFV